MRTLSLFTVAIGLSVAAVAGPVQAQGKYPERAVTIVVPFGPGGAYDILARRLAQRWEAEFKVPFVVQNLPGSAGRRGSIQIFQAKPDGYTIGFPHYVAFLADQYLRGVPLKIDYTKYAVVYKIVHDVHHFMVRSNLPYKSLQDLKKAGKPIRFATTGPGAVSWVEANAIAAQVGFPINFVFGYDTLTAAAIATARGDADASNGTARQVTPVKDDLRPLVYLGPERDPAYPDVPSAPEAGHPALANLGAPRVLAAPPGTPEAIVKVLRDATVRAIDDPEFRKWVQDSGLVMRARSPADTAKELVEQGKIMESLKPLIKGAKGK